MTKQELYKKACMLPLLPGVYIIRDKTDTIIYIGKAKRLRIRVQISAGHEREHLDKCIDAFIKVGKELGVLSR